MIMTPYGRSTTILGTTPTDMNFTGLYRHSKSNLDLATYRAYDPDLGRWLNRDPLKDAELKEGTNLSAYVRNIPIGLTDPSGKGVWTYFKCSHIRNKWYRDCFSKLPDCSTACGSTAQNKIETIAICMQDWQNRAQSCYQGMLKELLEAGCETISIGPPPGLK
jgi:RHS repeat-associated protein